MSTISANLTEPPPPPPRFRNSETGLSALTARGSATTAAASSSTDASGTAGTDAGADAGSLDPGSLTDRIDDLLTQQVGSGTLTQAQADTLKSAFENRVGGTGGGGGGQRPRGPSPGPPPAGSGAGPDTSGALADSTSTTSAGDLLASFVKQMQSAQVQSSAYAADGTRSGSQTARALLLTVTA